MATGTGLQHRSMAGSRRPGLGHRGPRSVFAKTLRDSWRAILVVGGLIWVMIAAGGQVMSETYGAPGTRQELAAMSRQMPEMLRGIYGDPVNVDTLGGFISWHYGAYFVLLTGLWSLVALSGTLAGEAQRGSLDLVVATPHPRWRIAADKVAGHVAALTVMLAVAAVVAWATGALFATFPGDGIPLSAAVAFAIGTGVRALVIGGLAFALAPVLGRGAAAGIAGTVMVAGYIVYGYRTVVEPFEAAAPFLPWSWAARHAPLAGTADWGGVAVSAVVAAGLLAIGTAGFVRRDLGVTIHVPSPGLPPALLGVRGPLGRTLGDQLPTAWWWSIGLGLYGLVMALASGALLDLLATAGGLGEAFRTMIPGIDMTTAAGFLQLAFVDLGFILVGLAAAMLVALPWGDESAGRLEPLLAAPLARVRWVGSATGATWLAIAGINLVLALAIGAGVASMGQDASGVMAGTSVLGLYGIALAGIGMGVGGIAGPSRAAPAVAAVAVGTFLLDTLAPVLRLPDWVAQLALTTHLGEPLVGRWDVAGIAACLAIATAGLLLAAWGIGRRDIAR